jgi:hypothetical protein
MTVPTCARDRSEPRRVFVPCSYRSSRSNHLYRGKQKVAGELIGTTRNGGNSRNAPVFLTISRIARNGWAERPGTALLTGGLLAVGPLTASIRQRLLVGRLDDQTRLVSGERAA